MSAAADELLSDEEIGYFFSFQSFPGPWPLKGFVSEFGSREKEHKRVLEALVARGLVEAVEVDEQICYQASDKGEKLFQESEDTIRAKWSFDGAETLSGAAALLRGYADQLEEREREGWQLVGPIEDDYGNLLKTRENVAAVELQATVTAQVETEIEPGSRSRPSELAKRD